MTTHTPYRCAYSSMSAAPTVGAKVVLMNTGNYPSFSSYLNETWTFSGTDWTNHSASLVDSAGPLPGRTDAIMAYDGANVMLYGGRGASALDGVLQDTWTFNGTTWTKQSPAAAPFGRYKAEAAYLAGTGVVMFGGETVSNLLNETWVWNGTTWAQISVANGTGPGARTGHAMAASASLVVLFGGRGTNSQNNHTWTFNGTTWTQLSPATSPSVRSEAAMVYDVTNSLWVLFGGQNEYNYLPETWTFNGTTWTQVVLGNGVGPSGRIGHEMAFDATSGKTILFGGVTATSNYPSNETWAFDGAAKTWTQL